MKKSLLAKELQIRINALGKKTRSAMKKGQPIAEIKISAQVKLSANYNSMGTDPELKLQAAFEDVMEATEIIVDFNTLRMYEDIPDILQSLKTLGHLKY